MGEDAEAGDRVVNKPASQDVAKLFFRNNHHQHYNRRVVDQRHEYVTVGRFLVSGPPQFLTKTLKTYNDFSNRKMLNW